MTCKLAVIGKGRWGKHIIQTAAAMETIEVVAIGSKDRDWHDVFDKKPDGVVIAADPLINPAVIGYANVLNIPVMVEKPAALYLSDIYKMHKMKIPVLVDYIHLFNPMYQSVKRYIKSPIVKVVSLGYNNGPFRHYSSLYDYAPHDLAMCMDLISEPFELVSQSAKKQDNGGVLYNLQFKAGETDIAILTGNGGADKKRQFAVWCENGDNFIFDDKPSQEPLQNVLTHFVDVIGGAEMRPSFDLTVRIHQLLHKLGAEYEKRTRS